MGRSVAGVNAGWSFLLDNPGSPTIDGNITRLFNTGDSKPPSCFRELVDRRDAGAISAITYGREGIANSFDASLARTNGYGKLGLDFVFREVVLDAASTLRKNLGLEDLKRRVSQRGVSRKGLGLADSDCLNDAEPEPLRLLLAIERGGGGLPGSLSDPDSVLARALIKVGRAQRSAGAAGSYGYGKAAVAQASKIRCLFAYSCFPESGSDPITRRILGVTYWGEHAVAKEQFAGWGLFGIDNGDNTVHALEDDEADAMAKQLGLAVRTPGSEDDLGTTFLLVDPVFSPEQLRGAVELSWWPLLQGTRPVGFDLSITDYTGHVVKPNVGVNHPVLGQFVRTFLDAELRRDNDGDTADSTSVVKSGRAGITSLTPRDPSSPIDQSLVALMRSPLMVVRYEPLNNANPSLVGVFVSHDSTNDNLRMVEPPEHDKWHAANVGGLNARSADIEISKAVRRELSDAVRELRGPDPEPVYGLSPFSRYFPAMDVKVARPGRPGVSTRAVSQRLVRVHLVHHSSSGFAEVERPTRLVISRDKLAARAEVRFRLDRDRARKVNLKHLSATLTIGARIAEEGAKKWEILPATVEQVIRSHGPQFTREEGEDQHLAVFTGNLALGESVHFTIETDPYPSDWTIEMVFDCSPWDIPVPVGSAHRSRTDH